MCRAGHGQRAARSGCPPFFITVRLCCNRAAPRKVRTTSGCSPHGTATTNHYLAQDLQVRVGGDINSFAEASECMWVTQNRKALRHSQHGGQLHLAGVTQPRGPVKAKGPTRNEEIRQGEDPLADSIVICACDLGTISITQVGCVSGCHGHGCCGVLGVPR